MLWSSWREGRVVDDGETEALYVLELYLLQVVEEFGCPFDGVFSSFNFSYCILRQHFFSSNDGYAPVGSETRLVVSRKLLNGFTNLHTKWCVFSCLGHWVFAKRGRLLLGWNLHLHSNSFTVSRGNIFYG